MAETVVSVAIDKISSLLTNEARFLSNVKEDVGRLQSELERMQSFLRDADHSQDQDERVRKWVSQIRDIAYDAEDVIDEFLPEIQKRKARFRIFSWILTLIKAPQLHEIGTRVSSIRAKIGDVYSSMQMAGIKFVNEAERSTSTSEMRRWLRRTDPDEEDEHVIKSESATRDVLARLMQQDDQVRVVSIVGMGGIGKTTLAKQIYNRIDVKEHFDCRSWVFLSQQFSPTDILLQILEDVGESIQMEEQEKFTKALKDKIYAKRGKEDWRRMEEEELIISLKGVLKDALKENRYLKRMDQEELIKALKDGIGATWEEEVMTRLNKALKERRYLVELIKAFKDGISATGEEEVMKTLHRALKERRYLVVLDDIWRPEAWDSLKRGFPNGKQGSKVLFTTRIKEVALYADPWSSPVEPPFLTIQEGWELLSKKAIPRDIVAMKSYAPQFEEIGKEMVRKLEGLPLAIAVLGGFLANKSIAEWEKVQKDINAQFMKLQKRSQYAGVEWILALSYYDLPYQLKQCFLYLSQFPEDSAFHKKRLIRMWIAEGFIAQPSKGNGNDTMEDVGEEYLEELVSRSMVQVSERDHTGNGIKICRMHDLMRDMCVLKASEEKFLEVIDNEGGRLAATNSRRVAAFLKFAISDAAYLIFQSLDSRTRSFLTPRRDCRISLLAVIHCFRLLRVLNLQDSRVFDGCIPREIGQLLLLRYLGLRNINMPYSGGGQALKVTSITLPSSIGNMKSLYTLDMRNVKGVRIPDVLWKLECLRHLLVECSAPGKLRLDTLKQLETLKWVRAKDLVRKDALLKLTNLRNLNIEFERREEIEVVLRSPIFHSGHLHSLGMKADSSFTNLEPLSTCHHLTKLSIGGVIAEEENQRSLEFLPASLAKLGLECSELKQDPMVVLEKLPNLRILSLGQRSYLGFEMACSALGFPRLEILHLANLEELEDWRVEKGAMPCLKTLILKELEKLRKIPDGLKYADKLNDLKLVGMPREFRERIQDIRGVGEDFHKVRHIPSISVT